MLWSMGLQSVGHDWATELNYEVTPLSFDLQGAFLHTCSWEGLLDFENEECVVFYPLSRQGPASSLILLLWSFCF